MPADVWNEALRMAGCGLLVAAAVAPVSAVGWWLARRKREPLLPRWKPWRVPWAGFEVLLAFLVLGPFVVQPLVGEVLSKAGVFQRVYGHDLPTGPPEAGADADAQARRAEALVVRGLWAGLASFPIQLGVIAWAAAALYPPRRAADRPSIAARLALLFPAWLALSLAVHAVHLVVNLVFGGLGWAPEQHALARVVDRPALDRALFAVEASVCAPVIEELCFRGIILPWLLKRGYGVWPVMGGGLILALVACLPADDPLAVLARGPVLFALLLPAGWLILTRVLPRKRRTVGAIYASAAIFAAMHSGVWPTPIPLFVLGLGLGWLAVRVRGFLLPAAVHGLFNAVSVVFILIG